MLQGIGRLINIEPISLSVALKSGDEAQSFRFSRTWTCPRTVLHLSAGPLALLNIRYLIPDDDLACSDLLIGQPVLYHLKIDTKTLLEQNRSQLDGTDCVDAHPDKFTAVGQIGRLMRDLYNATTPVSQNVNLPDSARPRVNYFDARAENDAFPIPSLIDVADSNQEHGVRTSLEEAIDIAKSDGISEEFVPELRTLVLGHVDLFRTTFSACGSAKVSPLKIVLKGGATPIRVKLRNYSQEQREFLQKLIAELVRCDMVYPNPTASWASAPLLVYKSGPAKFRFTVDLRPINQFTVQHHFPMPNLEVELTKVSSSRVYATLDLSHGYWQFPLDESSQECQSFITPDGVFTPKRVLHGTTNAVTYLQSTIAHILPMDVRENVLYWLDDILCHAPDESTLLKVLGKLFNTFAQYNIKLHPSKCRFFKREVRWCGRLLSADGVRFDTRNTSALLQMAEPTTGAHLQQFLCALQWVKTAIPNFAKLTSALHDFMERIYQRINSRTKRSVARVSLQACNWGSDESTAFQQCKHALAESVTLAHRDETKRLCLYTDASDLFWSAIMTQVPHEDLSLPHAEQRHAPWLFFPVDLHLPKSVGPRSRRRLSQS